jgi:hypothetical protein
MQRKNVSEAKEIGYNKRDILQNSNFEFISI